MIRSVSLIRVGTALALAAAVAACSGTTSGTASPSASPSAAAPSVAAESPSASAAASPSAAPSASAGAPAASLPSLGTRVVPVYAAEGKFMNAPIDPTVGTILTLSNVGQEAHSMVVLRRNADATDDQTFEDLSKLDPATLLGFVTLVGATTAGPGETSPDQIVLDEPGDYAIVDLLPKGTAEAPASFDPMALPTGIPNLVDGMFATFTVSEAEAG